MEDVRHVDLACRALTEADGARSDVFVHGMDDAEQVRARGKIERLLERSASPASPAAS